MTCLNIVRTTRSKQGVMTFVKLSLNTVMCFDWCCYLLFLSSKGEGEGGFPKQICPTNLIANHNCFLFSISPAVFGAVALCFSAGNHCCCLGVCFLPRGKLLYPPSFVLGVCLTQVRPAFSIPVSHIFLNVTLSSWKEMLFFIFWLHPCFWSSVFSVFLLPSF